MKKSYQILIAFVLASCISRQAVAQQEQWKKAAGDLQGCYISTMVNDLSMPYALLECLDQINAYCVTAQLTDSCDTETQAIYKQTMPIYQAEFENYQRSGSEYRPIFFDFRNY